MQVTQLWMIKLFKKSENKTRIIQPTKFGVKSGEHATHKSEDCTPTGPEALFVTYLGFALTLSRYNYLNMQNAFLRAGIRREIRIRFKILAYSMVDRRKEKKKFSLLRVSSEKQ